MTYDGENRPLTVSLDGILTRYVYGAGGQRVMKIDAVGTAQEVTTLYMGPVEIRGFGGPAEQVLTYPHPNVRIANGVASFLYHDQLGSVRTITDTSGDEAYVNVYRPFGQVIR